MTCHDTTLSLGVYLLGALEPAESAQVEAHLAECAVCRAELDELAALPAMLEQITLDDIAPEPVAPSDDLFERVAAQARAENSNHDRDELAARRSRYRRLTAVAAALAIAAGGGIGSWAAFGHHSTTTAPTPVAGRVHMKLSLASKVTGTSYTVNVTGLPIDEHCKLIAVAKDGSRVVAGRWTATYLGQANETGSTRIPRSQLAQFVLLGTNGQQLATVNV